MPDGGVFRTMSATRSDNEHIPCVIVCEAYQHHGYRESDTFGTLTAGQNQTVRGDTPLVVAEVNYGKDRTDSL